MKGLIFNIMRYSIHDGPGIRTTVFMKGCPMRCLWCHNPESQFIEPEQMTRTRILDGVAFEDTDIAGQWMEVNEVMEVIDKDQVFYNESGGGVTFSGGEPLMQPAFLEAILSECKARTIHTVLDTCGHASAKVLEKMIGLVDLFLYDLKLMDEKKHIDYTGVSNRIVLKNLKLLSEKGCNIRIRLPLIPGITDTEENIDHMKDFLQTLRVKNIDLLPYHTIARNKYKKLNREFTLGNIGVVSEDRLEEFKRQFCELQFEVNIGG